MAGRFNIIPERGLVYVEYTGYVDLNNSEDLFAAYLAHPDSHPGQKQLLNLAGVTGLENDYLRLMGMQAGKADAFLRNGHEFFLVAYAPHDIAYQMARRIISPWEGQSGVVTSIQTDEASTLAILGQPEASFSDLFRAVA